MKVNSTREAWKAAAEIFPTPYHKDEQSSERAGYSVYRSDYFNRYYCYICDLGDRLEINLDDGKTINIWISPEEDENGNPADEIRAAVEAMHNVEEYGADATPHQIEVRTKIEFAIDGYSWSTDEQKAIYKAMTDQSRRPSYIMELVAAYCNNNGLRWTGIDTPSAQHYSNGKNGGHFIITAYITTKIDLEDMYRRALQQSYEANDSTPAKIRADQEADTIKYIMNALYGRTEAAKQMKRATADAKYIIYGDEGGEE